MFASDGLENAERWGDFFPMGISMIQQLVPNQNGKGNFVRIRLVGGKHESPSVPVTSNSKASV